SPRGYTRGLGTGPSAIALHARTSRPLGEGLLAVRRRAVRHARPAQKQADLEPALAADALVLVLRMPADVTPAIGARLLLEALVALVGVAIEHADAAVALVTKPDL